VTAGRCDRAHITRHGRVVVGQIRVAAAGICDDQGMAGMGEIEMDLINLRLAGDGEVDRDKAADRTAAWSIRPHGLPKY
jgi:hypothetical protein